MKIPFHKPSLPAFDDIKNDFQKIIESGRLHPGEFVFKLEERLAALLNVKFVVAVNSCTSAMILLLSHIEKESKVVIPAFTFRAALQAVQWNGLTPVLVDVDENGYMDIGCLIECLKKHQDIKEVFPVHLFGNAERIFDINMACKEQELFYDAAHCLGSKFMGEQISDIGDASVFSLNITKPLGCGDGGFVATNDIDIAKRIQRGCYHGDDHGALGMVQKGFNGRMSEFTAVLALRGLYRLEENLKKRTDAANHYRYALAKWPVRFQRVTFDSVHSYSNFAIWVESREVRDGLVEYLNSQGIETRCYYPAISQLKMFNGINFKSDVAEKLANTVIALPCYSSLSFQEVEFICESIKGFYARTNVLQS